MYHDLQNPLKYITFVPLKPLLFQRAQRNAMNDKKLFASLEQKEEFEQFRKMDPEKRKVFAEKKKALFNAMSKEELNKYLKKQGKAFENMLNFAKKEHEELALYSQHENIDRDKTALNI
jgi:isochorismate synthase EntC